MRFCTNAGNMVLCRRYCFVEFCEGYGGKVLIQSRLINTVGYLRRVVLWSTVKVVKLFSWRVNRSGVVVQCLSLCLDPWDIARLLTHHGGRQLSSVLTKLDIGTVFDSVCTANLQRPFPVPFTSRAYEMFCVFTEWKL